MMEAMDWPPQDVVMEAFYCLILGTVPLGRGAYSAVQPIIVQPVQWVWLIAGDDLTGPTRGRNRGTRYRTNGQMIKELLYGMVPYACQKLVYSTVNVGGVPTVESTPFTDAAGLTKEFIRWTPPIFAPKSDQKSGVLYGAAVTHLGSYSDLVTS